MKQFLAVACLAVLALIVMDSGQVVTAPTGLTVKGGQALAADMPPPPSSSGCRACRQGESADWQRQRKGASARGDEGLILPG